jgi:hypothetical protein
MNQDEKVVKKIPIRKGIVTGRPNKVVTSAMRSKVAFPTSGGTITGSGGNFYSPELSTDFLELPQSINERWNYYRFFYDNEPFVGQAIDLHTELPLSKIRLVPPEAKNRDLAQQALTFCEKWSKNIRLLHRLIAIVHDYHLIGEVYVFAEDTSPDLPQDVRQEPLREITSEGEAIERWIDRPDADARAIDWLKRNYKGWSALRVLPPEQIHMTSFPFTDEKIIELVPDSKTKDIVEKADAGDLQAVRVVESMPQDIIQAIKEGKNIPLNTDPDAGSFVHYLARKRSDYDEHGKSILQRCLLPGTPIWIKRHGTIQQIAVEEVNDSTDLLLTHLGRFMPCKAGTRPVDEEITVLEIEGVEEPLKLTSDHEVLRVLEDGSEEWVAAGKLQIGDIVRESHVLLDGNPDGNPAIPYHFKNIDMVSWWSGRILDSIKRGRPGTDLLETERKVVVEAIHPDGNGIVVSFRHENDNRNRVKISPVLEKILSWAFSLEVPVVKTQAEVAVLAGVSERDVRMYVPRLRKEGLLKTEVRSLGRGKGQSVTWFPAVTGTLPPIITTLSSPIRNIAVDENFCWLLGAWFGDGFVWTEHETLLNVDCVGWSLHDQDVEAKVVELVDKYFGSVNVKRGCLVDKNTDSDDLRIEDPLLARWFMEEFGYTAQGKQMPEWLFHLPESYVLAFLRGLLDTDGWIGVDTAFQIGFGMDNKVLIDQMHLLCNRVGIKTHVGKNHKKERSWTRTWNTKKGVREKTYDYEAKTYPTLTCSRSEDVRRWAGEGSIKGSRVEWVDREPDNRRGPKMIGGWLVHRIASVLNTPYKGPVWSFDVEEDTSHFTSIITHNCLRTLVFRDKIRQAHTSIASRHMTPYRVIYAENMNDDQTEALRDQVDLALQDPDYSIITNFAVTWEEMGADQRLPDWSWVWDMTDRQLYAGLGVTESLLSGEGAYGGDRLHLEVINTRYMLLREILQDFVEHDLFRPMCARMGFVEEDDEGNVEPLVPRLSFTRLALRDNSDTFDALFNLYQKGSLDIDIILDLLNIDPVTTREKLQRDVFTLNDSSFNEVLRGIYQKVGDLLVEGSDVTEKIAENLGLVFKKVKEGGERF